MAKKHAPTPPMEPDAHGSEASEIRAATFRLSRRLRQQRAVSTMTDGQFAVLAALHHHGPHTLSALAEREGITPPSMNRTVNALEEAGYLSRASDPGDRRRVRIAITETGKAVVTETTRRRDEWLGRVIADLAPGERATLREAATIILREIERPAAPTGIAPDAQGAAPQQERP